jgi:hypothetical protein
MTSNKTFTMFNTNDPVKKTTQTQQLTKDEKLYTIWNRLLTLAEPSSSLIRRILAGTERTIDWIGLFPTDNAVNTALTPAIITYLENPENVSTLVTLLEFHFIRSNSTLFNKKEDEIFSTVGRADVDSDILPGQWAGTVECSAAQSDKGQCVIPILPINTVLIPSNIFQDLDAIYGISETLPVSKTLPINKTTVQTTFPKWLKKTSNNNNII